MTKVSVDALEIAHRTIEDAAVRYAAFHLIMGAQENANDTLGSQQRTEAWESLALGSLESLLAYQDDASVNEWFAAQGVRW
jgi:hypothetical protein